MAVSPPVCDFGWQAADFALPGTDGKTHALADIRGPRGTLIVFICNHCPYVTSVIGRLVADLAEIQGMGVGVAAISCNDAAAYPADSFDNMVRFAQDHGFTFPYLYDETQATGRAYGATCTPDFFGFDAAGGLQYRGRLDAHGRAERPEGARKELVEAMRLIADTRRGPETQVPSMGCSIKWKAA